MAQSQIGQAAAFKGTYEMGLDSDTRPETFEPWASSFEVQQRLGLKPVLLSAASSSLGPIRGDRRSIA